MKKWTFSIILIVFAFFLGQKANEKTGVLNESIFANVVVNPKSDTLLQIETSFLNSGCYKEFADGKFSIEVQKSEGVSGLIIYT